MEVQETRHFTEPPLDTSVEGVTPSPFRVFDTNEDLQQAMGECARQIQLAVEQFGLDVAVVTLGGVTRAGERSLGTLSLGAPLETFQAAEHIVKGVVVSLKALGPSEGTVLILPRGTVRGRAN